MAEACGSGSSCSSSSQTDESLALALSQGFYVDVKLDCPHIEPSLNTDITIDINTPCIQCHNVGENWVCLVCSQVFCSRYVQGHMVSHNESSQHPIALSFSDASVWCYSCESYIDAPILKPFVHAVGLAKSWWSCTEAIIIRRQGVGQKFMMLRPQAHAVRLAKSWWSLLYWYLSPTYEPKIMNFLWVAVKYKYCHCRRWSSNSVT